MSSTAIFILAFIDLTIGFLVWLYLKDYFNSFEWWKAAVIKSLVYSFFFGLGALGKGGGEPGFMLPYPIASAAIVALKESKFHVFVQNAAVPFAFWTIVLFALYCLKHVFVKFRKVKQVDI